MAAVSRIIQRSKRQEDIHKLVRTYVDVGLLPQLNNTNHRICFDRRGTGKTHVMKVLEPRLSVIPENTAVYIDCRTLGSTPQFSDQDVPLPRPCISLFRDILLAVHHRLLEHIVEQPSLRANDALNEADHFAGLVTEPLDVLRLARINTERGTSATEMNSGAAGISSSSIRVESRLDLGHRKASSTLDKHQRSIPPGRKPRSSFRNSRNCCETSWNSLIHAFLCSSTSGPLCLSPFSRTWRSSSSAVCFRSPL
jgi:hypothetical protein